MNLKLGYLVFGVRDMAAWRDFCERMLGLPPAVANPDGSAGWRIDDAAQRLIVQEDGGDDLAALGLDCGTAADLEHVAARVRAAGVDVDAAPAALRAARRVERLYVTRDPAGNQVELFCAAERADAPFESTAFPAGFRTGDAGMGHAALAGGDPEAMERFYSEVLGFAVTERLSTRAGPVDIRGVFLHCNRRHHSIALFQLPSTKRLHHFMLQARTHMDVGRALERAGQLRVPLSLDLGQHPAPDGTFSFYGITPSGFDFEIGAGSGEIEPGGWKAMRTGQTSSWGHRPQWRLKWRIASALLRQRLRVRRRV
ncbi:VOC family protein [Caenimonas aquaedulcis]|uniref:VOC family protein n=1 Tax=Caenimonas aquaedulcis TaxID=2793270 RepID=A0A931H842_9BURK|nr:VOC family protein [Caenimonas aquaedulcis]MBG9390449.1 VOC family protein [Caenimonas aquaedulcis]